MIWGGDNMAGNVKVLTNDLINDGIYVKNVCDNIKDNYDNVNNVILLCELLNDKLVLLNKSKRLELK